MPTRRILIGGLSALALAGGAAGAIAATSGRDSEQAVLERAAKQLDVTPSQLRDALGDALDAQIDQAVRDGRLTQARADELKQRRRESGRVLGIGPGHHRGGRGALGPRGFLGDAARALGLTEAQLHERLHDGDTLAEIADTQGKQLAAVKSAVRAAVESRLAAAVQAGRLTSARRDAALARFDDHFDAFAAGRRPAGARGRGEHMGPPPFGP